MDSWRGKNKLIQSCGDGQSMHCCMNNPAQWTLSVCWHICHALGRARLFARDLSICLKLCGVKVKVKSGLYCDHWSHIVVITVDSLYTVQLLYKVFTVKTQFRIVSSTFNPSLLLFFFIYFSLLIILLPKYYYYYYHFLIFCCFSLLLIILFDASIINIIYQRLLNARKVAMSHFSPLANPR